MRIFTNGYNHIFKENCEYWGCSIILSRNKTKLIKHTPPTKLIMRTSKYKNFQDFYTESGKYIDVSNFIWLYDNKEECDSAYIEGINSICKELYDFKIVIDNRIDKLRDKIGKYVNNINK